MTKSIPWLKIKAEYLQGAKPQELAKKYKIKAKAISDQATKKNWVVEKAQIGAKVRKDTEEMIKNITELALKRLEDVLSDEELPPMVTVQAIGKAIDISGLKSAKQEITGANGEPFGVKEIFVTAEEREEVERHIREIAGE